MIHEFNVQVSPEIAARDELLRDFLVREKGIDAMSINMLQVLKRSVDARQRIIKINLSVRVFLNEMPTVTQVVAPMYKDVSGATQAIVVGAGPAGLFAALRLLEHGIRPIIVERGQDVHQRRRDIAEAVRQQRINPASNYCFGEGGAGAFSDGKLFTRSRKRGDVTQILNILCQHGAQEAILVDAHPHIGTDRLPRVIENIRNTIVSHGGEIHFGACMDDILVREGKVMGIRITTGEEFHGPVILATGHSARDVYRLLSRHGIALEAKGTAIGVRLEHPQALIDQIQYHSSAGRGEWLPAAEYSFVTQVKERGVYSFCMCPGGFVVPAASDVEQIVVNGMSPAARGSRWANAGIVVELRPEDINKSGADDVFATLRYIETLERTCWEAGGKTLHAPAQRMADFTSARMSKTLPSTSYTPGLTPSPLHIWMPKNIVSRLQQAFLQWNKTSRGLLTNEATVIGVETRTSSPLRIVRHAETLQSANSTGLFPCGEGAGYAGGIVSAAIDGQRCADALAQTISQ